MCTHSTTHAHNIHMYWVHHTCSPSGSTEGMHIYNMHNNANKNLIIEISFYYLFSLFFFLKSFQLTMHSVVVSSD